MKIEKHYKYINLSVIQSHDSYDYGRFDRYGLKVLFVLDTKQYVLGKDDLPYDEYDKFFNILKHKEGQYNPTQIEGIRDMWHALKEEGFTETEV